MKKRRRSVRVKRKTIDFTSWCLQKHRELKAKTHIVVRKTVSLGRLDKVLASYGDDFSWVVVETQILEKRLHERSKEKDAGKI